MSSWASWMEREINFQNVRNLLFERFVEDQQNQQQQQQQHQRQQSQHGSTRAKREGEREGEREGGEGETATATKEGGYSGQT